MVVWGPQPPGRGLLGTVAATQEKKVLQLFIVCRVFVLYFEKKMTNDVVHLINVQLHSVNTWHTTQS